MFRACVVCCLAMLTVLGCAGKPPEGVDVVTGFELDRYLGTWYEIARLDHSFERGLSEVTAEYALRADGSVNVLNRGYDAARGQWRKTEGRAIFAGDSSVGSLLVSFFGPFYGGYHIIALDKEDYTWAMVAGPTRNFLWLLARSPELEEEVFEELVAQARELDFPVEELIVVEHGAVDFPG